MIRFRWLPAMLAAVMLVGCVPSKEEQELVQESEEAEVETTIIPSHQLDDSYYKTLIPYKESATRGMIVTNMSTKYDIKEAESGLMRISQSKFNTEEYYFQEGQYITADTAKDWLARESKNENGLNPAVAEGIDPVVRAKEYPLYLAHIIEQDYLTSTGDNKVGLGGISIGLAMNSVYYYQKEQYGEYYENLSCC